MGPWKVIAFKFGCLGSPVTRLTGHPESMQHPQPLGQQFRSQGDCKGNLSPNYLGWTACQHTAISHCAKEQLVCSIIYFSKSRHNELLMFVAFNFV